MTKIRRAVIALGLTALGAAATGSSSEVAKGATVDPEVLRLREAAWRAWFAGDESALGRMLPPEFIGINMQAGPFTTRQAALEQARAFRAKGGRLVRLEFPETHAQRYGDVVVLYGRYLAVMESEGSVQTVTGRLTEVFVRQDGRWVHPGWHLDTVS
jgi:hypothetical protein